jgi:hypothetical protein
VCGSRTSHVQFSCCSLDLLRPRGSIYSGLCFTALCLHTLYINKPKMTVFTVMLHSLVGLPKINHDVCLRNIPFLSRSRLTKKTALMFCLPHPMYWLHHFCRRHRGTEYKAMKKNNTVYILRSIAAFRVSSSSLNNLWLFI